MGGGMEAKLSVNLEKLSGTLNNALYVFTVGFFFLGHTLSFYFHFATVTFFLLTLLNIYLLHIQRSSTLLSNFGLLAQVRYLLESVGPEFRQYLYMSDTEERPFNRIERGEIYRKAKNVDSTLSFGSLNNFDRREIKLRHSLYPLNKSDLKPFSLTFGEERGSSNPYTITRPIIVSAMSYGALSQPAVQALARGAKKAGIPMNTGEGGHPKHHLIESCDLIFQMGTAKFGVRREDGTLDDDKLEQLCRLKPVKMVEIKMSQGAKPGKGGILPKEKITEEISQLRGVPMGSDVISPPGHYECTTAQKTVGFIQKVQEISQLPVGMKLCLGRSTELEELLREMKRQNIHPDYMVVDGSEGGTGAAPRPFMDDLGVPLLNALPEFQQLLQETGLRDQLKLIASGKLINAGRQLTAISLGADAIATARGFMLALGCIQALHCNTNRCPVGITTHDPRLNRGLDIEDKSERVRHYVENLWRDHQEMLASLGKREHRELGRDNLFIPASYY